MITFATVLLFLLPLAFLLAVLAKLATGVLNARREGVAPRIPTEPIVLMGLGFVFLFMSGQFVPIVARVANEQLRIQYPDMDFPITQAAFGVAAVVLVASFAKAAWTHLNLEEGEWGGISDYRQDIWPRWLLSGVEFWLRVGIAVFVVLLQKQIADLQEIDNIEVAQSWAFVKDDDAGAFITQFRRWLALTAIFGMAMFVLISFWLWIAAKHNWTREGIGWALFGTASFAIPGLFLCWGLNYLSTGSIIPTINVGEPQFELVLGLSIFIIVLAAISMAGIFHTLWNTGSSFYEFFQALRQIGKSKPRT